MVPNTPKKKIQRKINVKTRTSCTKSKIPLVMVSVVVVAIVVGSW